MRFHDRRDAGRLLAANLTEFANRSDVILLALPRGGVPVAAELAARLHVPFDVWLVRKLGVPGHPELAFGAIASGGVRVLNEDLIRELGIPRTAIEQVTVRERLELDRRDRAFRSGRAAPDVRRRTAILVDDGLATGATMEAAILAVRTMKPASIVAAAPVGARDTCRRLARVADRVVCPEMPEPFVSVGQWYEDFSETSDGEVLRLLNTAPNPVETSSR